MHPSTTIKEKFHVKSLCLINHLSTPRYTGHMLKTKHAAKINQQLGNWIISFKNTSLILDSPHFSNTSLEHYKLSSIKS